ncbi:hypothetical protein KP509_15G014000 [Ceratopteris richardii]|uniref:Uncharacterized protein n=2 Tax=Ceratopteris richardii TaxID=49495 RepID=A0A8T2T382_CERRI|nr:hypothetical protein KP509_15G014000 [Ceratopteris richardii]KAH7404183.1 hypothetical protein KP509_15G014000 [Ceratopteris richardii]
MMLLESGDALLKLRTLLDDDGACCCWTMTELAENAAGRLERWCWSMKLSRRFKVPQLPLTEAPLDLKLSIATFQTVSCRLSRCKEPSVADFQIVYRGGTIR